MKIREKVKFLVTDLRWKNTKQAHPSAHAKLLPTIYLFRVLFSLVLNAVRGPVSITVIGKHLCNPSIFRLREFFAALNCYCSTLTAFQLHSIISLATSPSTFVFHTLEVAVPSVPHTSSLFSFIPGFLSLYNSPHNDDHFPAQEASSVVNRWLEGDSQDVEHF